MSPDFFNAQIERLKTRFGPKAFDPESARLIAKIVSPMTHEGFEKVVDYLISSRNHTKPPLLQDFRDARIREEKFVFDKDVQGAANALYRSGQWSEGLNKILNEKYPGAKNLKDAMEIEALNLRVKKAMDEK